jgi:hypothetical protein
MSRLTMRHAAGLSAAVLAGSLLPAAPARGAEKPEPPKPTAHELRTVEGWTIHVDKRLLEGPDAELGTAALKLLGARLADIARLVAPDRLAKLREAPIWLDRTHGKLKSMQYHPSAGWLRDNGYTTELEKCVHIPDAAGYVDPHHQQRPPWSTLHERAHAYHDRVLGFEEPRIKAAWQQAVESKRYDKVLLIDGREVRHYAMTDHKEFFAEMTEAFFGMNDFFPFNRAELLRENPEFHALLTEIWGPVPDPAKVHGERRGGGKTGDGAPPEKR